MVIFFHTLIALLILGPLGSTWATPATPVTSVALESGRAALQKENLGEALRSYQAIASHDPLYLEKLEDLTRYMLAKSDPLEAWRLLQIGHRLKRFKVEWNDLERLAVFRAHSCPLTLPGHDATRAHLLNAAVYRFQAPMFEAPSPPLSPDDSMTIHLATGLTPYLADIPKVELVAGRGCRLAKMTTRNHPAVLREELKELVEYLDAKSGEELARLLVEMRALELARLTGKDKVAQTLQAALKAEVNIAWQELADGERQWLFVQVFGGLRLAEIDRSQWARAQEIAIQVLHSAGASPYWLAVVDLSTLTARDRTQVLSLAEKLGQFQGRAWVLYELARAHEELGNTREALTILRRLMVESEENLDAALEAACVRLAAQIFSQYQLDKGLQAALHAALPARLWNGLLEQAMIRAALAGHAAEFSRLEMARQARERFRRPTDPETQLNLAIARRSLGLFLKHLKGFKFNANRLQAYARSYASYLFGEDRAPENAVPLAPFTQAMIQRLHELVKPGTGSEDEANELATLMDTSAEGGARGARSVRKGVVKIGVARWHHPDLRPALFALRPPAELTPRELFYVPLSGGERGWKFSTAVP